MAEAQTDYCYSEVVKFSTFYKDYVHDYIGLIICVVGSVANIITIIVLTRKNMVSTTNIVLTGMVIADLALLLNYIPLACYQILSNAPSYGWLWFKLWLLNLAQMYRTISIWMTIMLAVWRYMAIAYPLETRNWCNVKRTYRGVVAGYVLCPLLCVPLFISSNVVPSNQLEKSTNETITVKPPISYMIYYTDKTILNVNFPAELGYFISSVFLKLMPSIILTILSIRLVFTLMQTKTRNQRLTTSFKMGNSTLNRENSSLSQQNSDEKEQTMNRTTRMLLALLFLFILAEVPNGILVLLMITHSTQFYRHCYLRLTEVLILLKMIDAAINFPVFYFMSSNFHASFHTQFNRNTRARCQNTSPSNATDCTTSITYT